MGRADTTPRAKKSRYNNYTGWYKLTNGDKCIPPLDAYMKSFRRDDHGTSVQYKSKLEFHAIRYCDSTSAVTRWSLEPVGIQYVKPTDNRTHRYYVDMYIEFESGDRFLVEVKSIGETVPPKQPRANTVKSNMNFNAAQIQYAVNSAKWAAAREYATVNGARFIILTERELYG